MTVEDRYDDFERRIIQSWERFNASVTQNLSQFITPEFIDYGALQQGYRPLANRFAADLVNIMILGANLSAKEASEQIGQTLVFSAAGLVAASTFQELNQRVVGILIEQQTEALAEMRRLAAQVTPIRSAAMVREGLTLTARQVRAVDNFRRMLEEGSSEALTRKLRDKRFDSTIRRAAAGEIVLTTEQIDRMVDRYRERYISFRARTIAATEAVRIANESDDLFFRQAIENGELDGTTVIRKWVTSMDEKVRSSHRAVNGVLKGPNEPWITGDGNSLRFPGDPRAPADDTINCRCWVSTKIEEASQSQFAA